MDFVDGAREFGERGTRVLGILRTMNDVRRSDAKTFNELIEEDYPIDVFQTLIIRKTPVGRLSLYGLIQNMELIEKVNDIKNLRRNQKQITRTQVLEKK